MIVESTDVYSADQRCKVKVAGVWPLLVLKLNVFGGQSGRWLPKDAYDMLPTEQSKNGDRSVVGKKCGYR